MACLAQIPRKVGGDADPRLCCPMFCTQPADASVAEKRRLHPQLRLFYPVQREQDGGILGPWDVFTNR